MIVVIFLQNSLYLGHLRAVWLPLEERRRNITEPCLQRVITCSLSLPPCLQRADCILWIVFLFFGILTVALLLLFAPLRLDARPPCRVPTRPLAVQASDVLKIVFEIVSTGFPRHAPLFQFLQPLLLQIRQFLFGQRALSRLGLGLKNQLPRQRIVRLICIRHHGLARSVCLIPGPLWSQQRRRRIGLRQRSPGLVQRIRLLHVLLSLLRLHRLEHLALGDNLLHDLLFALEFAPLAVLAPGTVATRPAPKIVALQ